MSKINGKTKSWSRQKKRNKNGEKGRFIEVGVRVSRKIFVIGELFVFMCGGYLNEQMSILIVSGRTKENLERGPILLFVELGFLKTHYLAQLRFFFISFSRLRPLHPTFFFPFPFLPPIVQVALSCRLDGRDTISHFRKPSPAGRTCEPPEPSYPKNPSSYSQIFPLFSFPCLIWLQVI